LSLNFAKIFLLKRSVEILILSDLHLGSYGCKAKDLKEYLSQIDPKMVILNGDIIDIWRLKDNYFPSSHVEVIKIFLSWINEKECYYITGNHDDALRKFSNSSLFKFHLVDKLILEIDGKKYWIFHGDVLDLFNEGWTKTIAKIGGKGYDLLVFLNHNIDTFRSYLKLEKRSFSKKIKNSIKSALKWISDFEKKAIDLALDEEYDYVICGHIHTPNYKIIEKSNKRVIYLNSGDWIENLTALEYNNGIWSIYSHAEVKQEFNNSIKGTISEPIAI
jgi:UDP-2,3-diacylglucosamine pyrophosphatase LpxH